MSAIGTGSPPNKVVAHWARKLQEAKAVRFPRLRSNLRSSPSRGRTGPSRHRTTIQKNIYVSGWTHGKSDKDNATAAQSTTGCPRNEHSPGTTLGTSQYTKLADAGYTTVFNKHGAAIYDDETTEITTTSPPILESKRCEHTGMWRLDLNPTTSPPTTDFSGTMHPRDSQLKRLLSTPYATETTQHGQN